MTKQKNKISNDKIVVFKITKIIEGAQLFVTKKPSGNEVDV